MEISVREGSPAVVAISGSVDGMTSGALQTSLSELVRGGRSRLVADFSGVDYISSAGLRALLATVKDARQAGGDLRLANVKPAVIKVLELSGFTSILKVFPDDAAACASFGG